MERDRVRAEATELFNLKLLFVPNAELTIAGASAEFFMGNVRGIGEVAATYADASIEEIKASLPHWESTFEVLYARFLDRKEP